MPKRAVRIEGLRELDRAFKLYGQGLEKGLREAMEAAAEPVKSDAQTLARSTIKVTNVDWSSMRIGVSKRTVYVGPTQRGRNTPANKRRSNLRELLLGRALEPALDANVRKVEQEFGDALDDLGRMWSRV